MITLSAQTQNKFIYKFGKGLTLVSKDESFKVKFSARIQNRFDGNLNLNSLKHSNKFYLRRARLKFDGYALTPKLKYKMEFDMVSGQVLDAVIKWNFAGKFQLWVGQTKLPGNRERVISSQKLQFVDRSLLNSKYTIDRDMGLQLRHTFNIGNMVVREAVAVSLGEGKNIKLSSDGFSYTGRLELLPFGNFESKGDYFSADLKREDKPKLALGATYNFNHNATKSGGQIGSTLSESRNLSTIFADLMFKYKGLSIMGEYANKTVLGASTAITDTTGTFVESFYTGQAVNAQIGYLLPKNWEISGRYTIVLPETASLNNNLTQYTLGLSKYIIGHSLKVQSDISYIQEQTKDSKFMYRFQVELAF